MSTGLGFFWHQSGVIPGEPTCPKALWNYNSKVVQALKGFLLILFQSPTQLVLFKACRPIMREESSLFWIFPRSQQRWDNKKICGSPFQHQIHRKRLGFNLHPNFVEVSISREPLMSEQPNKIFDFIGSFGFPDIYKTAMTITRGAQFILGDGTINASSGEVTTIGKFPVGMIISGT